MSTKQPQQQKRKRGRPPVADPRAPFYVHLGAAEVNRLTAVAARDGLGPRPWARTAIMAAVEAVERK